MQIQPKKRYTIAVFGGAGIGTHLYSCGVNESGQLGQGSLYDSALPAPLVCCSVLQCVVVCCSVLQCVAVCCSVLQGSSHDSALPAPLVCCSVLQCVAV